MMPGRRRVATGSPGHRRIGYRPPPGRLPSGSAFARQGCPLHWFWWWRSP